MSELKAVDLGSITEGLRSAVKPVKILWQADDTLAFVARGRKHRSEFHSDPSDEVMYMIKGDMSLHYRTPQGESFAVRHCVKDITNALQCTAVRCAPRWCPWRWQREHGQVFCRLSCRL